MKIFRSYAGYTILFGALAAMACYGALKTAPYFFPAGLVWAELPWLIIAAYCLLLTLWAKKKVRQLFFPFLLLAVSTGLGRLPMAGAAIVLAWVRSGVCFTSVGLFRRILAEFLVMAGALVCLTALFGPYSIPTGLWIWFFFLIQAAWFPLAGVHLPDSSRHEAPSDPFNRAFRRASSVLNDL